MQIKTKRLFVTRKIQFMEINVPIVIPSIYVRAMELVDKKSEIVNFFIKTKTSIQNKIFMKKVIIMSQTH